MLDPFKAQRLEGPFTWDFELLVPTDTGPENEIALRTDYVLVDEYPLSVSHIVGIPLTRDDVAANEYDLNVQSTVGVDLTRDTVGIMTYPLGVAAVTSVSLTRDDVTVIEYDVNVSDPVTGTALTRDTVGVTEYDINVAGRASITLTRDDVGVVHYGMGVSSGQNISLSRDVVSVVEYDIFDVWHTVRIVFDLADSVAVTEYPMGVGHSAGNVNMFRDDVGITEYALTVEAFSRIGLTRDSIPVVDYDVAVSTGDMLTTGIHVVPHNFDSYSIIDSVTISFTPDTTQTGTAAFEIRAVLEDDPVDFATGNPKPSERATTTAFVDWDPVPNFNAGVEVLGPDVYPIIQEVEASFGSRDGKNLAFIITGVGYRDFKSYQQDSGAAPKLTISGVLDSSVRTLHRSGHLDGGLRVVGGDGYYNNLRVVTSQTDADTNTRPHSPGSSPFAKGGYTVTNLLSNPDAPVTQDVEVTSGDTYILTASGASYNFAVTGALALTLSGSGERSVSATASSTGTATVTVNASADWFQLENGTGYPTANAPYPYLGAGSAVFGHNNSGTSVAAEVVTRGAQTPVTPDPIVEVDAQPYVEDAWPYMEYDVVGLRILYVPEYANTALSGDENVVSILNGQGVIKVDNGNIKSTIDGSTVSVAHTWSADDVLDIRVIISKEQDFHQIGVNGTYGTSGTFP